VRKKANSNISFFSFFFVGQEMGEPEASETFLTAYDVNKEATKVLTWKEGSTKKDKSDDEDEGE
jgi:hypothetical protein